MSLHQELGHSTTRQQVHLIPRMHHLARTSSLPSHKCSVTKSLVQCTYQTRTLHCPHCSSEWQEYTPGYRDLYPYPYPQGSRTLHKGTIPMRVLRVCATDRGLRVALHACQSQVHHARSAWHSGLPMTNQVSESHVYIHTAIHECRY